MFKRIALATTVLAAMTCSALALIQPSDSTINLICGMSNYQAFTSTSPISFVNVADQTALENDGYSIVEAGKTLMISGVGKSFWGRNRFIDIRDGDSVKTYNFLVDMPSPKHSYGSIEVPTINLKVKAGETIDLASEVLSAVDFNDFPDVEPGFFSTSFDASIKPAISGAYVDKGRLTRLDQRVIFTANENPTDGIIEFPYSISQNLNGGENCDPWTQSATAKIRLTVIGSKKTSCKPTANDAKFVFRYRTGAICS